MGSPIALTVTKKVVVVVCVSTMTLLVKHPSVMATRSYGTVLILYTPSAAAVLNGEVIDALDVDGMAGSLAMQEQAEERRDGSE